MLPRAVCLAVLPPPDEGWSAITSAAASFVSPTGGRRLLTVTTAGAAIATAFRVRGGRL